MRASVALGSNLGDRLANLKAARKRIGELPGVEAPNLASSVYETEPVNCEAGAGKFLNAVIEFQYDGEASELLRELREIEADLGRSSAHARNVSRTIDLDLLYFGDVTLTDPALQLPHPRMTERRFVLEPLAELAPDLRHPVTRQTIREMLGKLAARPIVRRVG